MIPQAIPWDWGFYVNQQIRYPHHWGYFGGAHPGKAGIPVALTDVAIRSVKSAAKPIKFADGGGMFLLVILVGGKLWRLKYRVDGREKLLALGSYPEVGLGAARRRREAAREFIALGKDPCREQQREKVCARIVAVDTVKAIADEYCAKRWKDGQKGGVPATAIRGEYLLSLACGLIGKLPIGEIEPADVLPAVRRIEGKRKLESARRSLQLASAMFRYAVATARLRSDPSSIRRSRIPGTGRHQKLSLL